MKTVYIPKGETVHYETLMTDRLVVKGCLDVVGDVCAKSISGSGVIHAGSIRADTIRADELEAANIVCKRLLAKRVEAPEITASDCMAVSCFLSAAYVETGKLTAAVSEISEIKAEEIVNLTPKKRGLLGTLLASALRSFWVSLTTPVKKEAAPPAELAEEPSVEDEAPQDEENAPLKEEIARTVREIMEYERTMQGETDEADFELKRFTQMFKLLREQGYTLRIEPGTPEENAPVFDFEAETIQHRAA